MVESDPNTPHAERATAFAQALVDGRFEDAHSMLTDDLKDRVPVERLQAAYEGLVEYGTGPVQVDDQLTTMEEWPDKRTNDVGWAYISISGTDFVEAVTVVVSREGDELKIRNIEWGRP